MSWDFFFFLFLHHSVQGMLFCAPPPPSPGGGWGERNQPSPPLGTERTSLISLTPPPPSEKHSAFFSQFFVLLSFALGAFAAAGAWMRVLLAKYRWHCKFAKVSSMHFLGGQEGPWGGAFCVQGSAAIKILTSWLR